MDLIEFHNRIAFIINPNFASNLKFREMNKDDQDYHSFPSVSKGPVNIEKIKSLLNFNATNVDQAFRETIEFYDNAFKFYSNERKLIVKEIRKCFLNKRAHENFEYLLKFDDFLNSKI
jgi:hypothetical protein